MANQLHLEIMQLAAFNEDGFDMYRVPGMIVTGNKVVLAYCDGRRQVSGQPLQTLFMFRSEDGGQNFSQRTALIEGVAGEQIHNPLMIAGRGAEVHFFWNLSYSRFFYRKSDDAGLTWGPIRELTGLFSGYQSEYPWNAGAYAPGHGIMLRSGRLLVPAWLSTGGSAHQPARFTCIYSDDNGNSWQRGHLLGDSDDGNVRNLTEGAIAELSNGQVAATLRHGNFLSHKRAFAVGDGGIAWGQPFFHEDLPDPICAGSLCRLDFKDNILLFSNCAWEDQKALAAIKNGSNIRWSTDARQNLTIRVSRDDGRTWSDGALLEKYGGYSDLAASPDGKNIFCFYESGWIDGSCILNRRLLLARFNLEWLEK